MSNHRTRINVRQLADRLATSKQTIWRWYENGSFPRPHYLGQNRVWWMDEIEEWELHNSRTTTPPSVAERARQAVV